MGIGSYDAIDDIISILHTQWNSDNTDVPEPKFTQIFEEKAVGIIDDVQDVVLVTPGSEKIDYFSLYGVDHLHYPVVILDIRGYGTKQRHRDVVDRIDDIIKDEVRRETSSPQYTDLRITASRNLSHNYRNMYRHVMEATYRILNP
jgi:hypothetical protein